MKKLLDKLSHFFSSSSSFTEEEWVLKYQINTMLLFSFFFGLGVFCFSIFRFLEGNHIVALSQLIFSTFSLYGFVKLKKEKKLYAPYTLTFFIIFFLYSGVLFFYVPQNTLNILWIVTAPILIFFFLNKKGGIAMFLLIFGFILYLIVSKYPYNRAEFITLLAAFFITSYMMYMYEKVKEKENKRLLLYGKNLENEVEKKTKELQQLNETLEQRIEQEVQRRQNQEQMLYSQNRLANMGMMIDSIAHQWRQPLTHINTILMNISRKSELEPENIDYIDEKIEDIFNITQHMSQTINDFRNLLSPKKELTTFSLNQLILSLFTLMKDKLQNVNVTFNPQDEISINSNKNELSQVILIVLQNAIEALEENEIKEKSIEIKITKTEANVIIEIIDNAQGVAEDKMAKIFNPYFTTKTSKSATGLGLYISKLIMEHSLKGEITFQNMDNGVKFSIMLPLITVIGHNKSR